VNYFSHRDLGHFRLVQSVTLDAARWRGKAFCCRSGFYECFRREDGPNRHHCVAITHNQMSYLIKKEEGKSTSAREKRKIENAFLGLIFYFSTRKLFLLQKDIFFFFSLYHPCLADSI
jgi:hypothetical protein